MADTSPVAHEGNPKEAEITIGVGEVLSTATLTVELPFIPIETPPTVIVPPPGPGADCICDVRALDNPCTATDYMQECFIPGALDFDPHAPWQFDGCDNTGGRDIVQAGGVHFISGTGAPKAGYTLYFGGVNQAAPGFAGQLPDNQTLGIRNFAGRIFNNRIGQPIVGFAVNVDPDSTCQDFTAVVLIFDWVGDRIVFGTYANADLAAGDIPTILQQLSPIPDDINEIIINNGTPSGGDEILEVFINGSVTSEYWTSTPAQAPIGEIVGMGLIVLGNPTTPNPTEDHSIDVAWDVNTAIILRWNN